MSAILDRILKLFRLGEAGRGATEHEMLAAVTKARQMMVKHRVSQADVQNALNAQSAKDKRIHVDIHQYTAYTRKMRNLARYDSIVSLAVGVLTETEPVLQSRRTMDGWYISMTFVGDPRDTAVASELFMIWLPEVRRAARVVFGSGAWGIPHTSYAIGYATRIYDRTREAVATPDTADAAGMALVMASTKDAIAKYKEEHGIAVAKARKLQLDASAYGKGYRDGADFSLTTKVMR